MQKTIFLGALAVATGLYTLDADTCGPAHLHAELSDPFTGQISGTLTAAHLMAQPNLGLIDFEDAVANTLRGNAHVNVHTQAHPPGEVRGQIDDRGGPFINFNF